MKRPVKRPKVKWAKGGRLVMTDGAPIQIDWTKTTFNQQCCDCGLTHDFLFRVKGKVLTIVAVRDRRVTAQVRRHMPNVRVRQLKERA